MTEINFKSSIGKLCGFYNHNKNQNAPVALIINNAKIENNKGFNNSYDEVVKIIFDIFVENNFSVLTFNLRPEKPNSKEEEEELASILDLTAALDWLHSKNMEARSFWVCGLDTSSIPVLQLAMRRPEIENYILLSPNTKKSDLGFVVPCAASGLLIRASNDLMFTEDDCINFQEKLITKTESKIRYLTIHNSERDFENQMQQLKNEISKYVKNKIAEDYQMLRNSNSNKRRRRKKRIHDSDDEKILYTNPIKSLDLDNI